MGAAPRVLAIVGPTGSGKTGLACEVARGTGAEVISADSMQVYRGMDIGTAKPTRELRAEVAHHAIDIVAPDEPMSAGIWAERARAAAREILAREKRVILCGGTGLYARVFAGGLIDGVESDPEIRATLETRDATSLHRELRRRDPASAERIQPGDKVRTVRALEVLELGGRTLSERQAEHDFADRPFDIVWLGLDLEREALSARLRARAEAMFDAGLVDEVRSLHAAGYGPELRPLQSIGYREVGLVLAGLMREAEARESVWIATRRYAKRQRTWFRAEPGITWLDAGRCEENLKRAVDALEAEGASPR